ncbi:hypothetical protein QBC44DRAFT_328806 [Cladorrhinum sp. PSN332]|nr:hypothetical protein QBC44DRAFT_328806 [Cladorrhinum sp. PSN332]
MADPVGLAGSIVGIVAFGLKLGTTLQTYVELALEVEDCLRDITFDVTATASALRQLDDIINIDKAEAEEQNRPTVFKEAALVEIQALAFKCEQVYKTILVLAHKASGDPRKPYGQDAINNELLCKPLNVVKKLRWPWLEPRVARCHDQLRWLKVSILLNLQIANLAQLHLDRPNRTFDQELGFRLAAEGFRHRQVSIARKMAKRENKAAKKTRSGSPSPSISTVASTQSGISSPPLPQTSSKGGGTSRGSTIVNESVDRKPEIGVAAIKNGPVKEASDEKSSSLFPAKALLADQTLSPAPKNKEATDTPTSTALIPGSQPTSKSKFSALNILNYFRKPTDSSSTDLEAWIISSDDNNIRNLHVLSNASKLPFGRQQLEKSLKDLHKKPSRKRNPGCTFSWPPLVSMTPSQRKLVETAVTAARQSSPHLRTCLAVQEQKDPGHPSNYIVYFSLSPPPEPIFFTDCVQRSVEFPYEQVKRWEDMKSAVCELFKNMYPFVRYVHWCHYDLVIEGVGIVLPAMWSATVTPGARVKMEMWPAAGLSGRPSGSGSPPLPPDMGAGRMMGPGGPTNMFGNPHPGPYLTSGPTPTFAHGRAPMTGSRPGFGGGGPMMGRPGGPFPPVVVSAPKPRGRKAKKKKRVGLSSRRSDECDSGSPVRGKKGKSSKSKYASVLSWMIPGGDESESDSEDENKLTKEEEEELKVVDFAKVVKEAEEKEGKDAVAEMLRRFTNMTDVESGLGDVNWSSEDSSSDAETVTSSDDSDY